MESIAGSSLKGCNLDLLTSPAIKNRIAARNLELKLKFGHLDEESGKFVPPRQVLLYLARMGSFSSTPKILNNDSQDNDLVLPANITRNELIQYCQKQSQTQQVMVKRAFRRRGESICEAKLNNNNDFNANKIRICQWNILSQALGQTNDHFVKCPDEALEWNSRKFLIAEEILEYHPDIICLQEVDHFNFLKQVLDTQGYSGIFYPKPDSPCMYLDGNNGPDGCAIFYRRQKFDMLKYKTRTLEIWRVQSNQVALLANLRIKETGQKVCVATTHLKARNGALLSMLRHEQGKDLLEFASGACDANEPLILCGDFNAEPIEPVYKAVCEHRLNLASAYAECGRSVRDGGDGRNRGWQGGEPPYTTWKIRDEGEVCHTIDYVFYSKENFEVDAVLEMPSGEDIGEGRVPSLRYPSDHFSLVCDLKLTN